jgi:phosphohistidine swiveling domain-containing protein
MLKKLQKFFEFLDSSPNSLGVKAANLAKMQRGGFSIPPALVIRTKDIHAWLDGLEIFKCAIRDWRQWAGNAYPDSLKELQKEILRQRPASAWDRIFHRTKNILPSKESLVIIRLNLPGLEDSGGPLTGNTNVVLENPDSEKLWSVFLDVLSSAYSESTARNVLAAGIDPANFRPNIFLQIFVETKISGTSMSRHPSQLFTPPPRTIPAYSANPAPFGSTQWVEAAAQPAILDSSLQRSATFHEDSSEEASPTALISFWHQLRSAVIYADEILGGPAEVKWVFDGKVFWIIKASLIATKEAQLARISSPGHVWTRAESFVQIPGSLTPISWSLLQSNIALSTGLLTKTLGISSRKSQISAVCIDGYVYQDPKFLSYPDNLRISLQHYIRPSNRTIYRNIGVLLNYLGRRLKGINQSYCRSILGIEFLVRILSPAGNRIIATWGNQKEKELDALNNFATRQNAALTGVLSDTQLYNLITELQLLTASFLRTDFLIHFIKKTLFEAISNLWQGLGLDRTVYPHLFRTGKNNLALRLNGEMQKFCDALRIDPFAGQFIEKLSLSSNLDAATLAGDFLQPQNQILWKDFLLAHSHVCPTWELSKPSWGESPSQLAPLFSALTTSSDLPRQKFVETKSTMESRLRIAADLAGDGTSVPDTLRCVALVEKLMAMGEEQYDLAGKYLTPMKALLRRAAESLLSKKLITNVSDAFYLTIEEILWGLRGKSGYLGLLAAKRRQQQKLVSGRAPTQFPASPAVLYQTASRSSGTLNGEPITRGIAQGIVCLADGFSEAKNIVPGSILVLRTPNRTLVPLFPMIGGLVTGSGDFLSPGIVAARESGIPTISGVSFEEMAKFSGKKVHMNGATGEIILIEESGLHVDQTSALREY